MEQEPHYRSGYSIRRTRISMCCCHFFSFHNRVSTYHQTFKDHDYLPTWVDSCRLCHHPNTVHTTLCARNCRCHFGNSRLQIVVSLAWIMAKNFDANEPNYWPSGRCWTLFKSIYVVAQSYARPWVQQYLESGWCLSAGPWFVFWDLERTDGDMLGEM